MVTGLHERRFPPMKATTGTIPAGPGWIGEIKWDGMRVIAVVADGTVTLQSASGRSATGAYPELAALASAIDLAAVLDGEVVALVDGRPSFQRLQGRIHVKDPVEAARKAPEIPIVYSVFDLLHLDGHDTHELAWEQRRELLEGLIDSGAHWMLSSVHDDPAELFAAVAAEALEGIIVKRRDSVYEPGRRSRSWVKVKSRFRQELVVGGFTEGERSRGTTFGALLVGYHEAGSLRFAGRVGTGFDDAELRRLTPLLTELEADGCPFAPPPSHREAPGARWIRPELVVEVAFAEWTDEGRVRHPAYLGQRIDADPAKVVLEPGPRVGDSRQ